jgi:hypothetical protein
MTPAADAGKSAVVPEHRPQGERAGNIGDGRGETGDLVVKMGGGGGFQGEHMQGYAARLQGEQFVKKGGVGGNGKPLHDVPHRWVDGSLWHR